MLVKSGRECGMEGFPYEKSLRAESGKAQSGKGRKSPGEARLGKATGRLVKTEEAKCELISR